MSFARNYLLLLAFSSFFLSAFPYALNTDFLPSEPRMRMRRRTPEGSALTRTTVRLERTTILHVWMRALNSSEPAVLYAGNLFKSNVVMETQESVYFVFKEIVLNTTGNYMLAWPTASAEVSYLYAFEPEKVKLNGIRPYHVRSGTRHDPRLITQGYHFRTPLGWANEPNGFSRTKDNYYHVFYQHIPNQSQPSCFKPVPDAGDTLEAMHWGHAISKDLINWVHLPVFLVARYAKDVQKPQNTWVQHWFSGSAFPEGENGLRIFVTSMNMGLFEAKQVGLATKDGVFASMSEEKIIVHNFPDEPEYEGRKLSLLTFRDPNVFMGPGDYYYMTLGTEDATEGGAILLYRTERPNDLDSEWQYRSVLLMDNRDDVGNIECPGLVPLGDVHNPNTLYALMYGREYGHTGNIHRLRDTMMVLGRFDGNKFEKIAEQTLDFAFGSYGHQAFYDSIANETLSMGWQSWWNDWDMHNDFASSESLPRVLKVAPSGDHILIGPHPNVLAKLRKNRRLDLDVDGTLAKWRHVMLPGGMAYIRIALQPRGVLLLKINHPAYSLLGVLVNRHGLELLKEMKELEGMKDTRRFIAHGAQPDIVHVFVDRDSLEIYGEQLADGGMPRWLGTTRLTGNGALCVESVELALGEELVNWDESGIWEMRVPKVLGALVEPKPPAIFA